MLVLLIIFMVAAPLLTSGVPLELPQAKGKQLEAQDTEPVVVSVTSDGRLFLGQEDKTPIELDELGPKLQAVAEARGGMDEPIFVRGDRAVEYGTVAGVMARIKEAGFRKLSLVTEVEAEGERAVQLGLTVSILLHLTILGWAFISLQSPEPFRVSEPEPVEVALVTAEDIVRLTKGDRSAKQLEAQQAETQRKPLEEGKAK